MKKLLSILFVTAALFITSCEGPMGPPGLPGKDGLDGDSFIGSVFEIQGDFLPDNEYKLYFPFPNDFEIYDTDVVLVYILWEQVDGLDVWRLLPQTVIYPEGLLQYNFDYTVGDVQIFMDGTIPQEEWLPGETLEQIFRIAVLPADFTALKSVDINDFEAISKSPQLQLNTFKNFEFSHIDSGLDTIIEK